MEDIGYEPSNPVMIWTTVIFYFIPPNLRLGRESSSLRECFKLSPQEKVWQK